ncbi:MAG: TIGR03960 family B12-binding radical SAM protein [Treponema sp.]|nr:TIGR03960 family B12-binding radical SAM protein [Treponema sp.]
MAKSAAADYRGRTPGNMPRFIDPFYDLGTKLLSVEKPARYSGGEYGSIVKKDALLRTVVAFPDLYEIGMSNQALRIIYKKLNEIPGVSCDRVFTPAPDFEKLLESENIPLYGLDTGIALRDADIICLSLGYELGITGALAILRSSGIPVRRVERGERDPVVLMGGPCISNPLPYSRFIDAFWIGEAEAGFFELCEKLLERKKTGALRDDIFSVIASHPNVWIPGKSGVSRAIYADFGQADPEQIDSGQAEPGPRAAFIFPVSNIKTVQHHGTVEIMRGCPNGCRFCHAGIWYRPMRQKNAGLVVREVDELVNMGGYREISLSSLSSGDYRYIDELTEYLNSVYSSRRVSFQLPSLRVSGFSLPLLEKISEVRKSGLTFAVETPLEMWQLGINKTVKLDEVVSILVEAKRRGWRGAKFYFMIGLPPANPSLRGPEKGKEQNSEQNTEPDEEEKAIVNFIAEAGRRSRGHFHINIGVFVPKPHTPYERAAQLDEDRAWRKLKYIMSSLKPLGHKVSVHDPFTAVLEGLIARGNERAGEMIEQAFTLGARLDPWSEYFRKDIWQGLFAENPELVSSVLAEKTEETLPWSVIKPGTHHAYLEKENIKSGEANLTSPCMEKCTNPCGVCGKVHRVVENSIQYEVKNEENLAPGSPNAVVWRMVFSFSKKDSAVFTPHLGVIEVFSMALLRSGLRPVFTQGFNPHVKLDFASPAAVGTICDGEIACVDFERYVEPDFFCAALGGVLPAGFAITGAEAFAVPFGAKKHSPASLLYGFSYDASAAGETGGHIKAADEKAYRRGLPAGSFPRRTGLLARNPAYEKDHQPYTDYFDAYRRLYAKQP